MIPHPEQCPIGNHYSYQPTFDLSKWSAVGGTLSPSKIVSNHATGEIGICGMYTIANLKITASFTSFFKDALYGNSAPTFHIILGHNGGGGSPSSYTMIGLLYSTSYGGIFQIVRYDTITGFHSVAVGPAWYPDLLYVPVTNTIEIIIGALSGPPDWYPITVNFTSQGSGAVRTFSFTGSTRISDLPYDPSGLTAYVNISQDVQSPYSPPDSIDMQLTELYIIAPQAPQICLGPGYAGGFWRPGQARGPLCLNGV